MSHSAPRYNHVKRLVKSLVRTSLGDCSLNHATLNLLNSCYASLKKKSRYHLARETVTPEESSAGPPSNLQGFFPEAWVGWPGYLDHQGWTPEDHGAARQLSESDLSKQYVFGVFSDLRP